MKKTLLVCTLLGGALCQSTFAASPFFAVGVLPEVGSTLALLGLAVAGIAAVSRKSKK